MAKKPHAEMIVDEFDATIAERRRRGLSPQIVADLGRPDRTVPISLRLPSQLLNELRAEAARLGSDIRR